MSGITLESPKCYFCDGQMVVKVGPYEQYGNKINTVARNIPEYVCPEDVWETVDPRVYLRYKEWELKTRREYREKGFIRLIQDEIKSARQLLKAQTF